MTDSLEALVSKFLRKHKKDVVGVDCVNGVGRIFVTSEEAKKKLENKVKALNADIQVVVIGRLVARGE